MITGEERRKLEAEWSADDQSLASIGRMMKSAVLAVLVLGLIWIAAADPGPGNARQASADTSTQPSRQVVESGAMRASRQAFDERRQRFEAGQQDTQGGSRLAAVPSRLGE